MDNIKVKNILIAVSNKGTIVKLLPLIKSDKIWATEGTAKYIKLKIETVNPVALGFDFNGRIKNYKNVALAFDSGSIKEVAEHLKANQGRSLLAFRKAQAKKAAKFIAERTKLE